MIGTIMWLENINNNNFFQSKLHTVGIIEGISIN